MKKFIFLLLLFPLVLTAQTVYEPLHNDIYEFLGRIAQKGIIKFDDGIKPVSRNYIAQLLIIADSLNKELTPLEREELVFYYRDFGMEVNLTNGSNEAISGEKKEVIIVGRDIYGRRRLFSYQNDLFKINVSPILGYERGNIEGKEYSHRWGGVYFYGYLGSNIGFSFDFRDNQEIGKIDSLNAVQNIPGKIVAAKTFNPDGSFSSIDYSEVRTHLTYSWEWGHITAGKQILKWGYGQSGSLVLSDKAPSFPFISYAINPVNWLSFNFNHAFISSDVIDSTDLYRTTTPKGGGEYRVSFRKKYFVSHSFLLTPITGLSISLGESIIYSDNFEPIYTFPLMFFRLADHYLSSENINSAGANSQFFLSVSSRNHIKNTHLYGSAFIDEINTNTLWNPEKERNQIGFSLGGSTVDLLFNNFKFTVEYTKIYPFVYMHYIPTQTYQNASYNMGHWMGSNADLFYAALQYRIVRGLTTNIWFQTIRKGEEGTPNMQHTMPQAPFLFGLRKNYTTLGTEVKYEITHEFFIRGKFIYNKNDIQQKDRSYTKKNYNEFYMALYYGL